MDVFFLQARVPLVKRFQELSGKIEAQPYPLVSRFTSHKHAVRSLPQFHDLLVEHAKSGNCLLKGLLDKDLVNESRAGHTDSNTHTQWLLIDVDGMPGVSADDIMTALGAADVSYVIQYSASSGVFLKKGLSCHIFILLDRPVLPAVIKDWLIMKNLAHFKEHITLNRLGDSLHWPLDITTCQNDKLIYIAPPMCFPATLDQHVGPRIVLVSKANSFFSFPSDLPQNTTINVNEYRNLLRSHAKLPALSKIKLDKTSNLLYQPNPQQAKVTGIKVGEEFTHLNLNGGDSWGYYHLTEKPHLLYNFKGEPNYKISELLPDYWNDLQKAKQNEKSKNLGPSRTILAFRDYATDTYYNGWFDNSTNELSLCEVRSKERLIDFLAGYGVPAPDNVPDWNCTYDPHSLVRIDVSRCFVNWFQPSQYMLQPYPEGKPQTKCPPNILCLIHNVIGNDKQLVEHFIHWTACAFRLRCPNGTAWIFQGVPGTGKGMLINEVLRPLFGASNVAIKRMSELSDRFNEFIENTLLCFIDEIKIGEDKDHDKIMADLKQQITEPIISVRKMRTAAREAPNYTNWIFSTNNKQPIRMEAGDRRYNVGEFCEVMLADRVDTYAFVEAIKAELPAFVDYLNALVLDRAVAASVVHNEARQYMIESSMVTADVLANALNSGDLAKLYEYVDDLDYVKGHRLTKAEPYRELIKELVLTLRENITREELAIIFDCTVGRIPAEAAKFTQYLGHHGIRLKVVRKGAKTYKGMKIHWEVDPEWLAETRNELTQAGKVVPINVKAS